MTSPFHTPLTSPEERKREYSPAWCWLTRFRVDRWRVRGHSPAVRRSQAKANSRPPPRATPSIPAMVGMGKDAARVITTKRRKFINPPKSQWLLILNTTCSVSYLFESWGIAGRERTDQTQRCSSQLSLSGLHLQSVHIMTIRMSFRRTSITNPETRQVSLTCAENTRH